MNWHFYYDGPVDPTQDPNCATCLAAMQKKCPAHATSFVADCSHCKAAQGAPCHGHWGVKRALDEHPKLHGLTGIALEDFARVQPFALADLEVVRENKKRCIMRLRSFRDDAERADADYFNERELEIDIQCV